MKALQLAACLALGTSAGQPLLPGTSGPTSCPSFATLERRLDLKVAGIKPGTPLKEFRVQVGSESLNFENPQSAEGALFDVVVSEGNATVSDVISCRFNSAARLIACHKECCRARSRRITQQQYDALATGASRADVYRSLCSPGDVERDGPRLKVYYHNPAPVFGHDEGQGVMLVFERDRLTSKGMSVYY